VGTAGVAGTTSDGAEAAGAQAEAAAEVHCRSQRLLSPSFLRNDVPCGPSAVNTCMRSAHLQQSRSEGDMSSSKEYGSSQ